MIAAPPLNNSRNPRATGADVQCMLPSATLDAGGKPGAIFPLARVLL